MVIDLVDEAMAAGARQAPACAILNVASTTVQRWRQQRVGVDLRAGPKSEPGNKLSPSERKKVLDTLNEKQWRDLSPKQIVPALADMGIYLGSESTMYRLMRELGQNQHREASKPRQRKKPRSLEANRPNQVWSWDITYLKSSILGKFFYLYLIIDIWSRKIVGWNVHETEDSYLASALISAACLEHGVDCDSLTLHSDNGGPMKGATMLATLQVLGIMPSFSRPSVSNDNPYSESLFRTAKYRPWYPSRPFSSLEDAKAWVTRFVEWYDEEHLHSGITFVTPGQRHRGEDLALLEKRHLLSLKARKAHPERWSGKTRNWSPVMNVTLNPQSRRSQKADAA